MFERLLSARLWEYSSAGEEDTNGPLQKISKLTGQHCYKEEMKQDEENKCPAHCKVSKRTTEMKAVPVWFLQTDVAQLAVQIQFFSSKSQSFLLLLAFSAIQWVTVSSCDTGLNPPHLSTADRWRSFPAAEPHRDVRTALWSLAPPEDREAWAEPHRGPKSPWLRIPLLITSAGPSWSLPSTSYLQMISSLRWFDNIIMPNIQ